ncbi:MAG: thiamine-phosphate kinase [Hyphomicrobiaceae bacterium]
MNEPKSKALSGEESIIQQYLEPLAAGFPGAFGLKDDCAVFSPSPGHDVVLKTDPIAEGIHFLPDDDAADVGWKALAVNVSDLAAKGARPSAYLMALSFPEAPTHAWMARFAEGLKAAQAAFGVHLVGGDTDRRPGPLSISVTVLGEVPAGRMVRRGAAQPGDRIYVSGQLGEAAIGLRLRLDAGFGQDAGVSGEAARAAMSRYVRPQPRLALRDVLLTHARAAMDLSDGLAKDLGRMAAASGCGAHVELTRLPVGAAGAALLANGQGWELVAANGDDYEILAAVAPEHAAAFEEGAARAGGEADTPFQVTHIGEMRQDRTVVLAMPDGGQFVPPRAGWDHF